MMNDTVARDEELLDAISVIARRHLDWSGQLARGTRLVETLGLDSVRRLTLLIELEDYFRVCFDEHDEARLETTGDLVDLIRRKQRESTRDAR